MPYKDPEKRREWAKKRRPRKYPNGRPRVLTADMKEYKKKWRARNPGKPYNSAGYASEKSRELRAIYFQIILDHYGSRCACCSETNLLFLTVDHVDNDGKDDLAMSGHRLTGLNLYRKVIECGFPDRYQVLCMNCNWGKFRNGGVCPHVVPKTI